MSTGQIMHRLFSRSNATRFTSQCAATSCVTTVGAPLLQRLGYKHLTTLFYSTLMATAAAVDLRIKAKRRGQWDKAIAEAEQALALTDNHDEDLDISKHQEPAGHDQCPQETSIAIPPLGHAADVQLDCQSSRSTAKNLGGHNSPSARSNGLQKLVHSSRLRVAPQSMYAMRTDRLDYEQWTPKKLLMREHSIALLCTNLLLASTSMPTPLSISSTSTMTLRERDPILDDARRSLNDFLVQTKTRRPTDTSNLPQLKHPQYTPIFDTQTRNRRDRLLKWRLLAIFTELEQRQVTVDEAILEVIQRLLTAQIPPSLHVYTLLVNRLSRLRLCNLVDAVIRSINESRLRINEMTAADILTHYIRKRDRANFVGFVRRLEGHHGGIMLAHPSDPRPVPVSHVRHGKVIAPFDLDARLHHIIIKGYLSFDDLGTAKIRYFRMRRSGFHPDAALHADFLLYYATHVTRSNWATGLATWHRLRRTLAPRGPREADRMEEAEFYRKMLLLCKNHGRSIIHKDIYREALGRGHALASLLVRPPRLPESRQRDVEESLRRNRHVRQVHRVRWRTERLLRRSDAKTTGAAQASDVCHEDGGVAIVGACQPASDVETSAAAAMPAWHGEGDRVGELPADMQLLQSARDALDDAPATSPSLTFEPDPETPSDTLLKATANECVLVLATPTVPESHLPADSPDWTDARPSPTKYTEHLSPVSDSTRADDAIARSDVRLPIRAVLSQPTPHVRSVFVVRTPTITSQSSVTAGRVQSRSRTSSSPEPGPEIVHAVANMKQSSEPVRRAQAPIRSKIQRRGFLQACHARPRPVTAQV